MFPVNFLLCLCHNVLNQLVSVNLCSTFASVIFTTLSALQNMIYLPSLMRPMSDSSSYPNSRGSLFEPPKEKPAGNCSLQNVSEIVKKTIQPGTHHRPTDRHQNLHLGKLRRTHKIHSAQPAITSQMISDKTSERFPHSEQLDLLMMNRYAWRFQPNHIQVHVHSEQEVCTASSATLSQFNLHQFDCGSELSEHLTGSCPHLKSLGTISAVMWPRNSRDAALTDKASYPPEGTASHNELSMTHFGVELTKNEIEACKSDCQIFSEKLMYFPQINNRLRVQFKDVAGQTSSSQVHVPIIDKVPIEGLLPFVCGRNTQNFYGKTPVIVEKKRKSIPRQMSFRRRMSQWGSWMKKSSSQLSELPRRKYEQAKSWNNRGSMGSRRINPFQPDKSLATNYIEENSLALSEYFESESACSQTASVNINRRVVLNVSGLKFETWLAILENHPTTLLGDPEKRIPFWDSERCEYFFDRHRPSFEAIFNYYQYGGCLKRPAAVSDEIFLKELEFYQIEEDAIEIYKKREGYVPEVIILPDIPWKRTLWLLFEYPETSLSALFFSLTSVFFTVISIILFCVETLPAYSQTHCEPGDKPNFLDPFFIIETLCTLWFTAELIIRFLSCPSRRSFLRDFKNLIDLAAIVPYYLTLTNVLLTFSCEGAKSSASLAFLRVIRLVRVFKLTKHSSGLQVLVLTFKESIEGLSLFLVAFIVCILVFSSTIYYVELDRKDSQMESIPDAFWWAVITMCTVGYGDKVPKGPLGKIVGSVCAVAGVLTLAIPVPIITENFNKFYAHKTGRGRR